MEKTREERLAIKSSLSGELSKLKEKKILTTADAFKTATAGFTYDDLMYCTKMTHEPSHEDYMTYEDLKFEEKKLKTETKLLRFDYILDLEVFW